ncbi:MAG TPA: hypothetical protein VGK25_12675 [Ignavibacteria bacterium]
MKEIFKIVFLFILASSVMVFSQEKAAAPKDSGRAKKQVRLRLTLRNSPSITLEANVMYNYGVYELSGNYNGDFNPEQFIDGENFGVRHGIGGIITAKIPVHEKGNLRANFSISHVIFNSKFNKTLTNAHEYDFVKYSVFSGIIGIENNFTPNFNFKTYVGIGVIGSLIYGQARITSDEITNDLTILPAFRLGVSLNSGLEYMVSNKLGLNCGIRFTHANLWLKQSKTSNNPNEIYLNDARVSPKQPYSGFKQFAWGSFFAGVNLYFGITEKKYTFKKY